MDMNDRFLRRIVTGLGGRTMGVPREDGFDITAASEVMAILCLANDYADLKARLGRILVGFGRDGARRVRASDLRAEGAMAALLRDAMLPNLVQTTEGAPALVHGGPFGNIAHGCNSVVATRLLLRRADVVFTEAGFGFDLGAEKFLDIKCRAAGIWPHAIVLVVTLRALKFHGGVRRGRRRAPNATALGRGMENLEKHLESVAPVRHRADGRGQRARRGRSAEEIAVRRRPAAAGRRRGRHRRRLRAAAAQGAAGAHRAHRGARARGEPTAALHLRAQRSAHGEGAHGSPARSTAPTTSISP